MTKSGKLYTFGFNILGQCGIGSNGNKSVNVLNPRQVISVVIESDLGVEDQAPKFISVAAGREHSLAVS